MQTVWRICRNKCGGCASGRVGDNAGGWSTAIAGKPAPAEACVQRSYSGRCRLNSARNAAGLTGLAR
ncbi:hypothetical protein PFUM301598_08180 [Pseudomonas fluorescens]